MKGSFCMSTRWECLSALSVLAEENQFDLEKI